MRNTPKPLQHNAFRKIVVLTTYSSKKDTVRCLFCNDVFRCAERDVRLRRVMCTSCVMCAFGA